jgi:hypothetical protein
MKKIIISSLIMFSGSTAFAADNPSMNNGNPCFKEICIGDDITQVKGINWAERSFTKKPAQYKATDSDLKRIRPILKGSDAELQDIAFYWNVRQFNRDALLALGRIKTACQSFKGNATYMSESGYRTVVAFEPIPALDGGNTRYVVTTLTREYPSTWTKDQREEFGKEVQKRYTGIDSFTITKSTYMWHPIGIVGGGTPTLQLNYQTGDILKRKDNLQMQPGCNGSEKVKFD